MVRYHRCISVYHLHTKSVNIINNENLRCIKSDDSRFKIQDGLLTNVQVYIHVTVCLLI